MGLGTSLFLIAVGAILRFAVKASVSGISIATIGTILLIIGVIGLIISLLYMTVWARRREAVMPVRERETVAPVREREYL